jgi:hypothetical protein
MIESFGGNMKKIAAILLVTLIGWLPLTGSAAEQGQGWWSTSNPTLILGIGALAGTVVVNYLTGGAEALPFVASASGGTLWEGAMAANRVVMAASVVAGVWVADWLSKNVSVNK